MQVVNEQTERYVTPLYLLDKCWLRILLAASRLLTASEGQMNANGEDFTMSAEVVIMSARSTVCETRDESNVTAWLLRLPAICIPLSSPSAGQ